ncbi:2ccf974b-ec99-4a16-a84d-348f8e10738b [Thermothielavioides terrestris]|uniref:MAP kinase kinase kinase n=1 Tax=Thermothielavioides terrestris TaxID=2587410 RepID=A0A3S4C1B4_9PEZI|nr:2ccf974b-ec99-4a16-a84d-348f8e10738b [Thermothielavioides terrestris]
MASEPSPRTVRFSQPDDDHNVRSDMPKNGSCPVPVMSDSENSTSSGSGELELSPRGMNQQDDLGSHARYVDVPHPAVVQPHPSSSLANGASSRQRTAAESASYSNGATQRPQRPTGPARTPSNTYQPYAQRRPNQPAPSSFTSSGGLHVKDGSRPRPIGTSTFRAQEREYVRRLRQQDHTDGYFDAFASGEQQYESDSEGETPSSEGPFDSYDDAHIMFVNNEGSQITEEDLRDPHSRERLEWHGMLEAVLTGDVVRQEKKRLIGSADEDWGKSAHKAELWLGIRARCCGRHLPVQRRMIEEARATLDRAVNDVINFSIAGESEAGKPPIEQVRDALEKIDRIEALFPSSAALIGALKPATYQAYQETCETLISWHNVNEMINTELSILKKWVGNDDLDFQRSKGTPGRLSDETSFLDRLMKEEGLKSLHDDNGLDGKTLRKKSMLDGISRVITKAKDTLIVNAEAFRKRHLPPYIEELLTLISFPSRLIEEIIKVRLAYAKKMKESAKQNPMMQDQMISQFQVLLRLAIKIKSEYMAIAQPQPGWDLPPCIDEDFDRVILDALKYYFKMLNWKLSGNKNTFKEAELLFQEWGFGNEVGSHLTHGDVEVAEQFSSLTYKALNRLHQTFEKELQRRPKESVSEMTKRYKQILDSVRVRQRMLQRFSRMLSDNYENACDFTVAFGPEKLQQLFDRLAESGHFQVVTESLEHDGVIIIASPSLHNRSREIQALMSTFSYETVAEDPSDPYLLIIRAEEPPIWFGSQVHISVRDEPLDIKLGHMRLIAGGSQARLVNARKAFLDSVDMHIDLVVEQRSSLQKVNIRLMEIRKVGFKLSNAFMDSVETIRRQTRGLNCQELIQTCFIFATEFGQRSLLYMDNNRRTMNNMKLTKLALDWVSFICDDCISSDRKTFRWTVQALEFAMVMTRGRHILALGDDEYAKLRANVSGCMALLISHFDIMGARSSVAAQAEKQRTEALMSQLKRLNKGQGMDDQTAAKCVEAHRLEELAKLDEYRKQIMVERSAMGRVLEASNEVDRSLAWLSSTATNFTMRWQLGHFVGGGTFGNVYAAMNLDTGQLMAVKEIRLQDPKLIPNIAGQIRDEMRVLETVDHPNVVSYYGIEVHRDRVYMFMEFCSGGSLANLLEHGRIEDEQVIMVYALQLLEGLAYLHELKIAHRDIKPENILLDHNGIIKYVDFGAAKLIARQGRTLVQDISSTKPNKSMTGTPMYMSPEVIKGENPGHFGAVDIWSLGCVILEMATGRRPWANLDNEWAIMYNIAQGNPPQLPSPDQLSPQGIDFLKRCFARDSKKRDTAVELLQHEWIMTIRNRVVEPATPSSDASGSTQNTPITATSSMRGAIAGDSSFSQ